MFERFQQRSYELERLDTGDYTPDEYALWQREMPWIHRLFGEERAIKNSLLRDAIELGNRNVSVLDVGAGSGGILKFIKKELNGHQPFLVAAEISDAALANVRNESSVTGIAPIKCDALLLPFDDGALIMYMSCFCLSQERSLKLFGNNRVSAGILRHHLNRICWLLRIEFSPLFFFKSALGLCSLVELRSLRRAG